MRRWTFLAAGVALTLSAAAYITRFDWLPRGSYDGEPNRYLIRIDDAGERAEIEASIWLDSNMLSMFDVDPIEGLPLGHASLVEDLEVREADGDALSVRDLGMGDFEVHGGRRLNLRYQIRLDHDDYIWPAGGEEVMYRTDEGMLARVSTLLFADGGEQMLGTHEVSFELPNGWQAYTPWTATDKPLAFKVATRRELLSNVVVLGQAHTETVSEGGVDLTLVLGKRYVQQVALFRELLQAQLRSYRELFGAGPLASRYLVVVNEGARGDGGAFSGSFSQLVPGDATPANRVIWGHTMAHELLHFWNGLSMMPVDYREEWFKEGVTDYLTITTMARNGFIDEALVFKRLENLQRRGVLARMLQRLTLSVREAGKDKQPNRLLVYGGGSLAALALDVELRQRSDDHFGLPQLMQALYSRHRGPDQRYTLADIATVCAEFSGWDCSEFLAKAVESPQALDIRSALTGLGLRLDSFAEEIYVSREPAADAATTARFDATFGANPESSAARTAGLAVNPTLGEHRRIEQLP